MKYKRVIPFVSWLVFCIFTAIWLYTRPVQISFEFASVRNCSLELLASTGQGKNTECKEIITPWKTKYDFSLPSGTGRIRLIPGKQAQNHITIRNLDLVRNRIFRNSVRDPGTGVLIPVRDIVPNGDGFDVTGSHPELEIAPEFIMRPKPDIRLISLYGLLFLLCSCILLGTGADDWCRLGEQAARLSENLKDYCRNNRWFLTYAFACLIILFGYELFNLPITEDDDWYLLHQFEQFENSMPGAYSNLSYNSLSENFICHGRWSAAVFVKVFSGFCPVLSLFWCLLCISAVFLLMEEKLSLPTAAKYLLFPFFIGNPVYYMYFQFFMTNNIYGISCLLLFLVAVFLPHCSNWRAFALMFFAAVFVVCAGQSLILLVPLWFLLKKMSDGLDRPIEYKRSFMDLLKLCGFCLLILLGYFLSLKYSFWLYEVQWQYLSNFLQRPDSTRAVFRFARQLLNKMFSVYSGQFDFSVHGQFLLIIGMTAAVLLHLIRTKRSILDILLMVAALAGMLILPFALDIASFNTAIPVRSMASFPIMLTGLCILGWRALADHPRIRFAAGLLIVYVAVQYGILINQKAYAAKLRYDQDRSVLQSIKDRCYRIPEFTAKVNEKEKIPLAVVGTLKTPNFRTFPMRNGSMLNCSFEPAVVINMHLLGETYFYPASAAEMKRVFHTVMNMPAWPAEGSVRFVDGIMIVKLSDFSTEQCQLYGFPFRSVTPDNSIHEVRKLPARIKPVWSLTRDTLDSVIDCQADFSGQGVAIRPSGWHSLRCKAVKADPEKTYYLQLELGSRKKNGILYMEFSDPARYEEKILPEIIVSAKDKEIVLRLPGRYLERAFSILLGDIPGKTLRIEKCVIYELTGQENLLTP